jgi:hypothetical protein
MKKKNNTNSVKFHNKVQILKSIIQKLDLNYSFTLFGYKNLHIKMLLVAFYFLECLFHASYCL